PSRASASLALLPEGTLVQVSAASGDWLRVRLAEGGQRGWIHARYERGLDAPQRGWRTSVPLFLRDSPEADAPVVDYVGSGAPLEVLAERGEHLLLRNRATARVGWAPHAADS